MKKILILAVVFTAMLASCSPSTKGVKGTGENTDSTIVVVDSTVNVSDSTSTVVNQ